MKLQSDRHEVERSNVTSESEFKIKTTSKAFDILSKSIYTDPILAICRELSCNAYDAHTAANNTAPFEIHVPNSLEPWFHVKDFGTGLSDEDIMDLYSTYFASTKTHSDDFIGALGLGSKSPFSYTSAFEVISRFDQVKRTYSIFINEEGVPAIARLGEFVTDEANGLEVRITVKKEDFWTFQDKIRAALRWFPVKPTVVGAARFEWPEVQKESLSGKDWMMFDSNYADGYGKMTAVQGNVAYKVDISKLHLSDADLQMFENCHVVGFFEIGELEVAASREEIRYDDRSSAALVTKIKDVRAGILKSIESKVESLQNEGKNLWVIMITLNRMAEEMFGSRHTFNKFIALSKNTAVMWYINKGGRLNIPELSGHSVMAYTISTGGDLSKASVKRSHLGSGIDPETDMIVFRNDMKTGGIAKVTHFLRKQAQLRYGSPTPKETIIRTAIIIKQYDKPNLWEKIDPKSPTLKPTQVEWTEDQFEEEYNKIVEALGDVEVKIVSTDTPAMPRGRNGEYKSIPIFQFNKVNVRRYGKSSIVWDRVPTETLDLTLDSLYFFIRNGSHITVLDTNGKEKDVTWDFPKTHEYLQSAVKLINETQGTKFTMKNVFAVGSMAAKKIKKLPNWVNLFDALKTQMDQFKPAVKYFMSLPLTSDVMGLRDVITVPGYSAGRRNALIDHLEKLSKKSPFRLTLEPLIEDAVKYENLYTICTFVQKLDVDLGTKVFDNMSPKAYFTKHVFKDYPMLTFVNNYLYLDNTQTKLFFDYIDTIDRS